MYLARKEIDGFQHFILRESCRLEGVLTSRDLIDLGRDPSRFIHSPDEASYHVDDRLLDLLQDKGVTAAEERLEELLLPFVDPYLRERVRPFCHRHAYRTWQPADRQLRRRGMTETHAVDRRRLHFLRLGRSAVEAAEGPDLPIYTLLLDKSRDEIEQLVMEMERSLHPREHQPYLFAIFDLQRFFAESYARSIPQALDRDRLDSLFLEEFCRLAVDEQFWLGFPRTHRLPPYLLRYLFMYFDVLPGDGLHWGRFGRSSGRRRFQPARTTQRMSRREAIALFGFNEEQLAALTRRKLSRMYRRKAHEFHPDKGGDTEQFIRLTAAYEELLASLP
jgi:hypothetical protein